MCLQVIDRHGLCEDDVFFLAINYFDRFLAICTVRRSRLLLLAAACALVASKLMDELPLLALQLAYSAEDSFDVDELLVRIAV